ncbi:uncharacterized protein LOC116843914 isoform X2 [Odontomachus brunneus]|uniref:uncharacterized protein LOC116843914 isoform X2 n=2 Tax=Odontomachus brunneus TaxID=486640 RepID=UPI0013F1A79E|nr:uncharacterized protein LOC116843914 isoform X2 [Odontomachus brunneus]XP_032670745.1 uncharacterized protein LOC116843914 isoform X2 [Odontomachus brunneus]
MLRPNFQNIMDQYMEMCNMVSTLRVLNIEQQRCIELEREKSKKTANKMKNMVYWLSKREDHYKASLDSLEKENKDLRRDLLNMQRERDQAELTNNVKVSKLQDEVELLRVQLEQLYNEHKQLILQNEQHKNEIFKEKNLLENVTARLFKEQNVARKSKIRITETHPALTDEGGEQKINKLPGLKISNKRRKLFQEDNDTAVDII